MFGLLKNVFTPKDERLEQLHKHKGLYKVYYRHKEIFHIIKKAALYSDENLHYSQKAHICLGFLLLGIIHGISKKNHLLPKEHQSLWMAICFDCGITNKLSDRIYNFATHESWNLEGVKKTMDVCHELNNEHLQNIIDLGRSSYNKYFDEGGGTYLLGAAMSIEDYLDISEIPDNIDDIGGNKESGLFSKSKKPIPEELCDTIAKKLIIAALKSSKFITTPNNKITADVGAEFIYLFLHCVDRLIFNLFGGEEARDKLFDEISRITITDYVSSVLNEDTPKAMIYDETVQMVDTLQSRQVVYGVCESFTSEPLPIKGTMVFAFSCFVHKLLGHMKRDDLDNFLRGKYNISDEDLDDFPDIDVIVEYGNLVAVFDVLQIQEDLDQL